ncbi:MAG: hypothetical protein KGI89_02705 [Euryarchaeota archaeon]|nr:hypothetical protein [Euryarchaeota archaeon]
MEKDAGDVVSFVVNYVATVGDKECSVVRYDTHHGFPHKDILRPDGSLDRKESFGEQDLLALVDLAIDDLKSHGETYRARFERWRK